MWDGCPSTCAACAEPSDKLGICPERIMLLPEEGKDRLQRSHALGKR